MRKPHQPASYDIDNMTDHTSQAHPCNQLSSGLSELGGPKWGAQFCLWQAKQVTYPWRKESWFWYKLKQGGGLREGMCHVRYLCDPPTGNSIKLKNFPKFLENTNTFTFGEIMFTLGEIRFTLGGNKVYSRGLSKPLGFWEFLFVLKRSSICVICVTRVWTRSCHIDVAYPSFRSPP